MQVVVIGAGAVGSFLAWTLASAGHDVALLRRPGRAATDGVEGAGGTAESEQSLRLVRPDGTTDAVTITVGPPSAPPDLIVLAVKMPDLASALDSATAWPESTVLAAENGVGADAQVVSARPDGGILAGSLTTAVSLEDGVIHRHSTGGIGLATVRAGSQGGFEAVTAESGVTAERAVTAESVATAFRAGGLRAAVLVDPQSMRWSKLLANLVGNATSAILDMDPADVYADPRSFAIERRELREALAVMRRSGLVVCRLPGADVRGLALAVRLPARLMQPILRRVVAAGRGGKSPSLRLAVRSGGPTEVDWLQGGVATAAHALGGRAPVNERLATIVRECSADPGRAAWFRGRPDRLLDALD